MIKGHIRQDNRPAVPLVVGGRLGTQEVIAIIDTGFTGELKLPLDMSRGLGLGVTHTQTVLLANEGVTQVPSALAFVTMEGVSRDIDVLITKGQPIVGVNLLRKFGYSLFVDYTSGEVNLKKNGE